MIDMTTLARPYSRAAFRHAQASNQVGYWSKALNLAAAITKETKIDLVLRCPRISNKEKLSLFNSILGKSLNIEVENFIGILIENKRVFILPKIYILFQQYKDTAEKSEKAEVISAFPLDEDLQDNITEALSAKFNRKVSIDVVCDPSLIGGLVIRVGNLVIDGSVREKLTSLAKSLKY